MRLRSKETWYLKKKKFKFFFLFKKKKKLSLDKEKKEKKKGEHGLIEGTYELKCLNAQFENKLEVFIFCGQCYTWELKMYFYYVILKLCLYLNIGCKGIFKPKKCPFQIGKPLK